MSVKILSSEVIKPSTPTPPHLRTFKLSLIDQLSPIAYIQLTLFYPNNTSNNNILNNTPQIMSHLKKSLSETLTRFYPLAGRVKDFTSVDCNDEGVLFKEARANFRLPEYLENPNLNLLTNFLAHEAEHSPEVTDVMVAVQVTLFDCGGIVIGLSMLHRIVDATTMTLFLNSWAETSRGYEKITYPDLTTASHLFPSADSLPSSLLSFVTDIYSPEPITRRFVFDASAIAAIKARATSEAVPNPTRVEALTGFFWGRLMVAHKAITGALNICMATHAVNLRRRLELPRPNQTLGNLIWLVIAIFAPSDSDPELHELVELVHDTFANLSSEVIKELQGEEGKENIFNQSKELLDMYHETENLDAFRFTSWCNMGIYEADFGWGKPVWVGLMGDPVAPTSKMGLVFMDSCSGDGVEIWITYSKQVIALLEKDSEILAYATMNPPIPIPIPIPTTTP